MNQDIAQLRTSMIMMMILLMIVVVVAVGETSEAVGGISEAVGGTSEAGSVDWYNDPTEGSVDLLNALNESVAMHCWSRETNFGLISLAAGSDYSWNFHPNIFGRTVYKCSFLWKVYKQEFAVWKGSAHADRLKCCDNGPCSYKICPDGIYTPSDDNSWVLVEPWLKIS